MKNLLLSALFVLVSISFTNAADPQVWTVNTRADVVRGESRGVSIDANGTISLAPRLTELFKTDQPYVWSSAIDAAGNIYLGTGADGKVFKVDANGKGSLFADLDELNVSALAVGKGGEIFAATSPDGKVYRLDSTGKASVYFVPNEKYIWALAVTSDGSLVVATGDNGKIFKVKSASASADSSLLLDSGETHVISLAADQNGNVYAGTDSNGLVLKIGADGKAFALLDAPLREIHQLSVAPDGSVYVLALSDSVNAKAETTTTTAKTESNTVTVERPTVAPAETPKSRYDLSAAKSAVFKILPDGGTDLVWSSSTVVAFSVYAHLNNQGVLVGTADKGRIYNVSNDLSERLVLQSDEGQISTIFTNGKRLFATSSNQGKLYQFGPELNSEGTYESAVLDAKAVSSWGRVWWRSTGGVSIQTRSGNTEKPDETWSGWNAVPAAPKGAQITSPKARYLQWRATFKGEGTLSEVNVSFLARNIAPEVTSVQVLAANIGLAPNPAVALDPSIESSGMDPALFGVQVAAVAPRRVFQRGARAIQWTAEDRNGDKLLYDVYYRSVGESSFRLLKQDLSETFFTLDGQSLADGQYVFKIIAKDSPSNPAGQSLSGDRVSEPFDVDNTVPTVSTFGTPVVSGNRAKVVFDASDSTSYIARAEYSVNGGDWHEVFADDGISDGPNERYTFEADLASGSNTITLRVFDANGNAGTARVVVSKQ